MELCDPGQPAVRIKNPARSSRNSLCWHIQPAVYCRRAAEEAPQWPHADARPSPHRWTWVDLHQTGPLVIHSGLARLSQTLRQSVASPNSPLLRDSRPHGRSICDVLVLGRAPRTDGRLLDQERKKILRQRLIASAHCICVRLP